MKDPLTVAERNIHREIAPGTIAYFYAFHPETNSGDNFSLETWENGILKKKIMANSAQYNTANKTWSINNAQIRHYITIDEVILQTRTKFDTILPMDDQDFGLRAEISSAMTMAELDDFIDAQKLSGSGRVAQFEIEKYNRTAGPFAIFVLTLIGVSIASRKQRGGIGMHLMLAVVIGFIYVFISRMTTVSAMNLGLSASLAVWIPNILFLFVGLFLYGKAQK
jgi:lipopolysaccharide export system permease protein